METNTLINNISKVSFEKFLVTGQCGKLILPTTLPEVINLLGKPDFARNIKNISPSLPSFQAIFGTSVEEHYLTYGDVFIAFCENQMFQFNIEFPINMLTEEVNSCTSDINIPQLLNATWAIYVKDTPMSKMIVRLKEINLMAKREINPLYEENECVVVVPSSNISLISYKDKIYKIRWFADGYRPKGCELVDL